MATPRSASAVPDAGDCPAHLAQEIVSGNCVAFVGAGFSAAARLPSWDQLLLELGRQVGGSLAVEIERSLARSPSADARYLAAQLLEDKLGRPHLISRLRQRLDVPAEQLGPVMQRRLEILRRIPFRAILTTNFDALLGGAVARRDSYVRALRPPSDRAWAERFWVDHEGPPVLCIHGSLADARAEHELVLTRRDYRRRLYQDAGYQTFLRAILSTRTVLYLGFSFTDAYLNELRSEVLSLLDFRNDSHPTSYAVVADSPPEMREFYRRHEGIELLDFTTTGDADERGRDYSGFDRWLEVIYQAAAPRPRFTRMLAGRRVLWLDPHPDNNRVVRRFFESVTADGVRGAWGPVEVVEARDAEQARDLLAGAQADGWPFDLVLTHWGQNEREAVDGEQLANGPRLLVWMRREDLRAPVIVFSTRSQLAERKRLALSLGAQAYCFSYAELFREVEAVIGDLPRAAVGG